MRWHGPALGEQRVLENPRRRGRLPHWAFITIHVADHPDGPGTPRKYSTPGVGFTVKLGIVHFRRLACFLLGLWLGGGLFMDMVVTQNFRSVDRLLSRPAPAAAQQLEKLGHDDARMLLRHQVSEQNRWYFESWGKIEIAIGAAVLLVLLFGSTEKTFSLLLALLMLFAVIVQRFALTPQMVILGRAIDWVPIDQPSPERTRFWLMHNAYVGLEIMNWALGFLLTAKLLFRSGKRGSAEDAEPTEPHSRAASG